MRCCREPTEVLPVHSEVRVITRAYQLLQDIQHLVVPIYGTYTHTDRHTARNVLFLFERRVTPDGPLSAMPSAVTLSLSSYRFYPSTHIDHMISLDHMIPYLNHVIRRNSKHKNSHTQHRYISLLESGPDFRNC